MTAPTLNELFSNAVFQGDRKYFTARAKLVNPTAIANLDATYAAALVALGNVANITDMQTFYVTWSLIFPTSPAASQINGFIAEIQQFYADMGIGAFPPAEINKITAKIPV